MHHEKSITLLSVQEFSRLKAQSNSVTLIERRWKRKIEDAINAHNEKVVEAISMHRPLSSINFDVFDVLLDHAFESMQLAIKVAWSNKEKQVKLSKGRPSRFPTSFADLRRWYDKIRAGEKKPKWIIEDAEEIKKKYLEKCQTVWEKYARPFRKGEVFHQDEVRKEVKEAAKVTQSRASMIVATETTTYYNNVRKKIYDKQDAVTHYLFLSIRDARTTKWCKTRSGLVYKKDSRFADDEMPACHWNCRSEMVPLVRYNPNHKKLIEDKALARENNSPEPLPPGWRK